MEPDNRRVSEKRDRGFRCFLDLIVYGEKIDEKKLEVTETKLTTNGWIFGGQKPRRIICQKDSERSSTFRIVR